MIPYISGFYQKHAILVNNSGALAVGTGITSVLGFVYWWFAARTFSPEVIGTASALLALMNFVVIVGEGGLGTLLAGEVTRWPDRYRGLINAALLFAFVIPLIVGGIILALITFSALRPHGFDNLLLLIGFGCSGIAAVSDQAFVGMLQSSFRMFRQFLFSLFRIIFLIFVAYWVIEESAILFSWIAALILSLVVGELLLKWRGEPLIHCPDFKLLYMLRSKTLNHYFLDLGIQSPPTIMPYLVAVLLTPTRNAAFTVVWMVVSIGSIVPGALATVLFPVINAEPDQYRSKMLLSLNVSLIFAVLYGILIFVFSTDILSVFNPTYAEIGGTHMQFLGFGMVGIVIKSHVCAAARINNNMRQTSLWFFFACLFELACVTIGAKLGDLEGLSIAWTVSMTIEGGIMLLVSNPCDIQSHRSNGSYQKSH